MQDHLLQKSVFAGNKSLVSITILAYISYVLLFAILRDSVGLIIGALAVIPVVTASWYFGFKYGIVVAV